jgi:hypothetical protein
MTNEPDPSEHDDTTAALELLHTVLRETRADHTAPSSPDAVLTALTVLRELRERIATWEPELIAAARAAGTSWGRLAPAMGVTSRQAAERRYLRLRPGTGSTREARVQATRDQRAADRAVDRWARDNAAGLRQLAGQITALPDLDPDTQHHADEIHTALAGNDAATLLAPLTEMHTHLLTDHPELANQITTATTDAEHHRQTTLDHRHNT